MNYCKACEVRFFKTYTCPKCNQIITVRTIPKRTPLGIKHYLESEREASLINRLERYPIIGVNDKHGQ